jgi:membrane protease subunit (stomatin/prohibitin family)
MARTAVVAGTATAVVGGVSAHQQHKQEANDALAQQQAQEAAYQQQAAYAPPPPPPEDPTMAQLEKLAQLHNQGVLSDDEFAAAKAKALGI